ncbi:hypothetical protein ABZW30_20750 [Kitasatospora sp. NPDC004669]|uniref:hypothetical protein n=1 Tax=Kitasatospora sp. NPDC004669 TaxID=3154555 RepID=UPI0033B81B6A
MAAREDTARDVRDVRHEPERHGRHGRPRPFGGRFRLPTLRFSGAAMAMSTVVGISIATTLLLNEQQGIGRRAGVARVGTTPPPTPSTTDQAEAVAEHTPAAPPPSGRPHGSRPTGHPSTHPSAPANAATPPPTGLPAGTSVPITPSTDGQASAGQEPGSPANAPANAPAAGTGAGSQAGAAAGPSPSAQPLTPPGGQPDTGASNAGQPGGTPSPHPPGLRPNTPTRPAPAQPAPPPATVIPGDNGASGETTGDVDAAPGATGFAASTESTGSANAADATGATEAEADHALTGTGQATPLGRDGLRHALDLAVAEPVTALQAEFRLAPGELAPGSGAAWTDLPSAVVTVQQERGALVYRFTTPPGTDVKPGRYSFVVRGTRPAEPVGAVRKSAPLESWNAAAFGIDHPRAVAALGGFGPLLPLPAQPLAHAPR